MQPVRWDSVPIVSVAARRKVKIRLATWARRGTRREAISRPRDKSGKRQWHLGGAGGTFLTRLRERRLDILDRVAGRPPDNEADNKLGRPNVVNLCIWRGQRLPNVVGSGDAVCFSIGVEEKEVGFRTQPEAITR